jgi:DNA-binding transcriptional MerR regulator
MEWTLPGTVLQIPQKDAAQIQQVFSSLFLGGGIVLSQVSGITGLEPYTVQNWVKRGFLPPPEKKRYSLRQLCRIININMLKSVLPMERICSLLTYINGHLDDVSDDIIDDSQLYFMFVELAMHAQELFDEDAQVKALDQVLASYKEPVPGAKERVEKVLRIMLMGFLAAKLQQQTENMVKEML